MKPPLKLNSASVHKILLGLIFLLLLVWGYAPVLREGCESFPDRRVGKGIAIATARVRGADRSGFLCTRAYNNFDVPIVLLDTPSFKLEKSWIWPLWLPYFNLREFLPGAAPRIGFTMPFRGIAAGGYEDAVLPVSFYPASPGKYRVCLVYKKPDDKKKSRTCSAAFWLL
ncbi:MAG: hypothetical protein QXI19_13915 [Candidatus Caldarchaeum sp.]